MVRSFVVLAALAIPSMASAQTALVLPIGGDAALGQQDADEVIEHVWDALDGSYTLLAREELDRAIADAHATPCAEARCAGTLREALHADLAVTITLTSSGDRVHVVVVRVDADGEHEAEDDAARDDVATVTARLLSDAPPPVAPPVATGPDFGVIGSGSVLAAVGVGLLAIGIANAVDTEHCVSGCDPAATERSVYVPATDIGIGLAVAGGVAIAGGIAVIIVGALARVPRDHASFDARGIVVRF